MFVYTNVIHLLLLLVKGLIEFQTLSFADELYVQDKFLPAEKNLHHCL